MAARQAAAQQLKAAPFPPLAPAALAQLQKLLLDWQKQSQGTKTLECDFTCWHYDLFKAPAGIQWKKSEGVVKYAAPDKGLFKVEQQFFFSGMAEGKPSFQAKPDEHGEEWICNGQELIEFDHKEKHCRIQQLPPEMRGANIIESPLPFVFNLDAQRIQQRYWVRQVQAPKPGLILIEAYPKQQAMRAQYRLVQIALDEKTFMPQALLLYAPNFNVQTNPKWDHYEFKNVRRNSITQSFNMFANRFIQWRPPADYKIFKDVFRPVAALDANQNEGTRR
ncbi:MAG: TIGR03009 domain-containing protein [Planctomycetota bacterium]